MINVEFITATSNEHSWRTNIFVGEVYSTQAGLAVVPERGGVQQAVRSGSCRSTPYHSCLFYWYQTAPLVMSALLPLRTLCMEIIGPEIRQIFHSMKSKKTATLDDIKTVCEWGDFWVFMHVFQGAYDASNVLMGCVKH